MEEEKKVRNRENIENLQTLLKEMTLIEEVNESLNQEIESEKVAHKATADQVSNSHNILIISTVRDF